MSAARPAVLGELELAVMEHLWTKRSGDPKSVHRAIGVKRAITVNTIQSTLKRLAQKGLLVRTKVSHAHVYAPRVSRDVFCRDALRGVVDQLMAGRADTMMAAFVDVAEQAGVDRLAELERLVNQRLHSRKRRGGA